MESFYNILGPLVPQSGISVTPIINNRVEIISKFILNTGHIHSKILL